MAVTKLTWRDETLYGRETQWERETKWAMDVGPLRLVVMRHPLQAPNVWLLACVQLGIEELSPADVSAELAKAHLINEVKDVVYGLVEKFKGLP